MCYSINIYEASIEHNILYIYIYIWLKYILQKLIIICILNIYLDIHMVNLKYIIRYILILSSLKLNLIHLNL